LQEYQVNDCLFVAGKSHKPMSDGTMLQALYDLGYKGKATVHGFRATFSTVANDARWQGDYVEAALAHKIQVVRGAYNHSVYFRSVS
jgi:integrase